MSMKSLLSFIILIGLWDPFNIFVKICNQKQQQYKWTLRKKVSVFGVFLVRIFLHSDWITNTQAEYSSRMRENTDQKNSEYGHFLCSGRLFTYRINNIGIGFLKPLRPKKSLLFSVFVVCESAWLFFNSNFKINLAQTSWRHRKNFYPCCKYFFHENAFSLVCKCLS